MAFTVELWVELSDPEVVGRFTGLQLSEEVMSDPQVALLRWVDRWGDTVFNRAQCARLLVDIDLVAHLIDERHLEQLRDFGVDPPSWTP